MGFAVFNNTQEGAAFVICIVTMFICILVTVLRFIGTKRSARSIGLEDTFALLALVFYLAYTSMFLYALIVMNGRLFTDIAEHAPEAELFHLLKVSWAMSPQYCGNQLFAKLSLLVFYHRIFSVSTPFMIWIITIGVVQTLWFIATYLVHWFSCTPVYKSWDSSAPGICINGSALLVAGETINCLIDFVMIGVAVWMIRSLHMGLGTKWKLGVLFTIGGMSGIMGFIKIGVGYHSSYNSLEDPTWAVVQMAFSIVCCCAPMYKSVIPDLGIIRALRSYGSRSVLWASTSRASPFAGTKRSRNTVSARDQRNWVRMQKDSEQELATVWTVVEAGGGDEEGSLAMRRVQIQRNEDAV